MYTDFSFTSVEIFYAKNNVSRWAKTTFQIDFNGKMHFLLDHLEYIQMFHKTANDSYQAVRRFYQFEFKLIELNSCLIDIYR